MIKTQSLRHSTEDILAAMLEDTIELNTAAQDEQYNEKGINTKQVTTQERYQHRNTHSLEQVHSQAISYHY